MSLWLYLLCWYFIVHSFFNIYKSWCAEVCACDRMPHMLKPEDTATRSFIFCFFILAFTSADIIFHKFSELHATKSEKKIFVGNFPFLTDSLKPPLQHLHGQNPIGLMKVFCRPLPPPFPPKVFLRNLI